MASWVRAPAVQMWDPSSNPLRHTKSRVWPCACLYHSTVEGWRQASLGLVHCQPRSRFSDRPCLKRIGRSAKYPPLASTGPVSLCTGTHRDTLRSGMRCIWTWAAGEPTVERRMVSSKFQPLLPIVLIFWSGCWQWARCGIDFCLLAATGAPMPGCLNRKKNHVGIVGQPRREQGSEGRPWYETCVAIGSRCCRDI